MSEYIHPCDQPGSVADPTYVREADEARQELNELLERKSRREVRVMCKACNGTGRSRYHEGRDCDVCDGHGTVSPA